MTINQKRNLASIFQRIKGICCEEWRTDAQKFYQWYDGQLERQNQSCHYCQLPGNTEIHYGTFFRKGRRGETLEVDKMDGSKPYSPDDCVLACYPCNNAKSDAFSYEKFLEIGKAIHRVITQKKLQDKS